MFEFMQSKYDEIKSLLFAATTTTTTTKKNIKSFTSFFESAHVHEYTSRTKKRERERWDSPEHP